ncbi:hypothetical protein Pmar_PMAR015359, partial [Perkinsus marinus ATCC 50983]
KSESSTRAERLMQTALNPLQSWADDLKLTTNALETQCIAFILGSAKSSPRLPLYGQQQKITQNAGARLIIGLPKQTSADLVLRESGLEPINYLLDLAIIGCVLDGYVLCEKAVPLSPYGSIYYAELADVFHAIWWLLSMAGRL